MDSTLLLLAVGAPVVLVVALTGLLIGLCYRRIGPHEALVVNTPQGLRVHLRRGAVVLPILHRAEVVDLSTRTLELSLKGAKSLQCRNNLRADVRARFLLRISPTQEHVEKVVLNLGAQKASSPEVLRELFEAQFREALRTVSRSFDFEDWLRHQDDVRDQVVALIGRDLSGFTLDELHLEELEATPTSFYDKDNILDAEGLRRIVERTSRENLLRFEAEIHARRETSRLQLEADEARFREEQERALREALRKEEASPQAVKSAMETEVEAARARAAEMEAAFKRELEKTQADGRAASGSGTGGAAGASGSGFQPGLRKT